MRRLHWLGLLTLGSVPFAACGPDAKPGRPCEGPTYNLVIATEDGRPLPDDTLLNVRYGGNHEGEPYSLGETPKPQAVFCNEVTTREDTAGSGGGGNAPAGAGGAGSETPPDSGVWALSCRLYTQGPASIDVKASGYEPIEEQDLTLDEKKRCQVDVEVKLAVLKDAGL